MLLIKPVRERLEELTICLEYLDERRLKQFRNLTSMYFRAYDASDPESDTLRSRLAQEIELLIEHSENNRLNIVTRPL
jgi:hypothetical protein